MGSKKAPEYPTTTVSTGGLFGTSTTNASGTTFEPTEFQKSMVGITEANAGNALNNYLNPNYESEDYKRGDEYYTNKMNTMLQNDYLSPALQRNLLRGSTASDIMRGFGQDLANNEYQRQNDYRDQQLQNYMAAMLPYTTIYDMSKGTQGLSQSLANSVGNYNMAKYQADKQSSSGLGAALGGIASLGSLAGGVGTLAGGLAKSGSNIMNRYIV